MLNDYSLCNSIMTDNIHCPLRMKCHRYRLYTRLNKQKDKMASHINPEYDYHKNNCANFILNKKL